jgi:hypothetical protein
MTIDRGAPTRAEAIQIAIAHALDARQLLAQADTALEPEVQARCIRDAQAMAATSQAWSALAAILTV